MITLSSILLPNGNRTTVEIDSKLNLTLSNEHFLLLPAVIDPHVHFRTPGLEHKENWETASVAALLGGCTTVFDMPNTLPPTITAEYLKEKKSLIESQLKKSNIPLRYQLFFGADKNHFDEIESIHQEVIGIKVFMGCSTGNLVIDDDVSLARIFEIAARYNLIVAVHAEDEALLKHAKETYQGECDYTAHSLIRNETVAITAVNKAIAFAEHYQTKLYILHLSTEAEVNAVRKAKQKGLSVYAETTPHHLFLNDEVYSHLHGKAVVNPPLRAAHHQPILWEAIRHGVIDTIGSDHAPHTLEEKNKPYGQCPSGMPGIEFTLPLLLNAYHQGLLTLPMIEAITSTNAKRIFHLENVKDFVIVDLNKTQRIAGTASKCGWTSYEGMELTGWPVYTILNGEVFECDTVHHWVKRIV